MARTLHATHLLARPSLVGQIGSQLASTKRVHRLNTHLYVCLHLAVVTVSVLVVAALISKPSVALPTNDAYQAGTLFETFMDAQVAETTNAAVAPPELCLSLGYQPPMGELTSAPAHEDQEEEEEDEERVAERVRDQMDRLAERLLKATEGQAGAKMRASLAEALNLRQIIGAAGGGPHERSLHVELGLDPMSRAKHNMLAGIRAPELRSALDVYDLEQSIDLGPQLAKRAVALEHLRHSLSSEQYKQQVASQVSETLDMLGPVEQARLHEAALRAYGPDELETNQKRRKRDLSGLIGLSTLSELVKDFGQRKFRRLVDRVLEIGLGLFDRFTATTQFLQYVPSLSKTIRELREQGKPLFVLVENIRKLHYLFKMTRCPKELQVKSGENVDLADEDKELTKLVEFCREHYNPAQIGDTVRVVSGPAAQAIAMVTKRLTSTLTDYLAGEVASRATYALMSYALSAASAPKPANSCGPAQPKPL